MKNKLSFLAMLLLVAGFTSAQSATTIKELPAKGQLQQANTQAGTATSANSGVSDGKKGINAVNVKQAVNDQEAQTTTVKSKSNITNNRAVQPDQSASTSDHAINTKGTPGSSKPVKDSK